MIRLNRMYSAIALIAGTSIGAAILSLPVVTAPFGFLPTVCALLICWLFMTYSALLLFEANSVCGPSANLITMARHTCGWPGVVLAWTSYLMLLYALMVAYLSGLGAILHDASVASHHTISIMQSVTELAILLGLLIYVGKRSLDMLNRLLFAVLIISFLIIVTTIMVSHPGQSIWQVHHWHAWDSMGMIITSFGFAIIVPSLRRYCGKEAVKLLPKAILIGSLIPLGAYLIWEMVMLAEIPTRGHLGLLAILTSGQPATGLVHALNQLIHRPWLAMVFRAFTFAIITTSLLGVAMSLFDFLEDGFALSGHRSKRLLGVVLTLAPPAFFAVLYPAAFIGALRYASLFVAILLGLLPTAMVTSARRQPRPTHNTYRAPGGHWMLTLNALFFMAVLLIEIRELIA